MLTLKDLAATVALTAVMLVASLLASPVDSASDSAEAVHADLCATGVEEVHAETTCAAPLWTLGRR